MLQKRRDLGSMPDGLGNTTEDIVKGTAVVREMVEGEIKFRKPASTSDEIYGFITLRIDDVLHTEKFWDTIPAGKKAVVYTLVKNNEWATSEFTGKLDVGDYAAVVMSGDNAGKIIKVAEKANALFEIVGKSSAMAGYNDELVTVKVL